MAADWLLVETFGGSRCEPTVLAAGSNPKNMVPLRSVLGRGPFLADALGVTARVIESRQSVEARTTTGRRRVIGHPLLAYGGLVHGVYLWVGPLDEDPPPRAPGTSTSRGTSAADLTICSGSTGRGRTSGGTSTTSLSSSPTSG
ncbi:DUF5593 domain-containing protein [Lentzea sp. NEAU-D13]|uniref:DUF5593 domain-containing protein n=2 Tax=Lentzea alba TaxID=2714351 RepID=A0A7C9RUX2_9PSEU|nr:DUF5593 domain-containing protein [Lentzea alba]